MATPKWFDANAYMQNKLAQLKAQEPDAGWTLDKLYDAFREGGFVGAEGQYERFVKFGAAEEVAPNAYFNADEYYAAKAHEYYGDKFDGSEEQIATVKAMIKDAGMNAWTHYQQFGSAEGVNPSNAFDASDYCAAKAEAMNKAGQKDPDGNDWTAESIAKAIDDAGMSVLEHYLTYAGTGEGEVAAGSTYPVADEDQVVVPNPGETFVLKAGIEQLQGTSGDDVFKAEGTVMDAGDVTDGGAGNDTLEVYGNAALKGAFTNIENLVIAGDSAASEYDLSSFSKSFTLKADADTKVTNVTNQTLVMDGADSHTLTVSADQASVKLVNKGSADATFKAEGAKLESVSLTTDANTTLEQDSDTVKNVAITALANASIDLDGLDKLENVTVTGVGAVDLTVGASVKSVDATSNVGGVAVDLSSATAAAFTGGAGNDTITLGESTKAHDMGAGDDTVELNGSALGKDGSVDGGDGVDTLVMSATNAAAMTAENFKAFTNFEVLGLNGGNGTIKLDSFGDINHVAIAKALGGAVTIENMDSEGTLEFNIAAGQNITVNVTEAGEDGHTTDVLNVKLSAADSIANAGNTLTVADVETINIEADDADDDGDAAHTLQLAASDAKTVNVTGDADLTLSGTFAAGATINAANSTGNVTMTLAEDMTFLGGAGDDTITLNKGVVVDGGAGKDIFKAVATATNDITEYVTIQNFTAEDKLDLTNLGSSFKKDVDFSDNQITGLDKLDLQNAATAALAQTSENTVSWFEHQGSTYLVVNGSTSDAIIEVTGVDMNDFVLDGNVLTLGA